MKTFVINTFNDPSPKFIDRRKATGNFETPEQLEAEVHRLRSEFPEMTKVEIAEICGISKETVNNTISKRQREIAELQPQKDKALRDFLKSIWPKVDTSFLEIEEEELEK